MNQLQQFKDDFLMYGRYNIDSLDKMVTMVNNMNNKQTDLELLFQKSHTNTVYDFVDLINFQFNLQMFLTVTEEEYVSQLQMINDAGRDILRGITELSKGYLPRELFPDVRLQKILKEVKHMVKKRFPDYDLADTHISHYRDMKLVTFLVDRETHSLIVSFPVFIQNFKRKAPLPLYEIESTYVPVPDKNTAADSYTKIRTDKVFFAGNKDYYIQIRISELMMCKSIRYTYYCEELFIVKHRSKHTCDSTIFYKQPPEIVSQYCSFDFYFNKTVTPVLLDGGKQILLANFQGPRSLQCIRDNSGLAKSLPQHTYAVVPREFLCDCQLDLKHYSVLRQLGACRGEKFNNLNFTFIINLAFHERLLEHFPNQSFRIKPNVKARPQTFDIKLEHMSKSKPLSRPIELDLLLDRYAQNYDRNLTLRKHDKQDRPQVPLTNYMNKILTIVCTATSITLLIIVSYILIKHFKLKFLVSSLVVSKLPLPTQAKAMTTPRVICSDPTLTTFATVVTILGVIFWLYAQCHGLTWLRGYKYARACTLYVFLFNNHRYVPIKIRKLAGHMHMYHLSNSMTPDQISYSKNFIWDILHFDWSYVDLRMNSSYVTLPCDVQIPFKDKIKVRRMIAKEDLDIQFMILQGTNWYSLNKTCSVPT